MDSEHWFTAMDGTDNPETENVKEKEEKDKDDAFKTPKASPRGEGETKTPDDPFSHTPPFGLPPSSYSTPQSTPGTPGRLKVVTEGTP